LNSLGVGTTFVELSTQSLKDFQVPWPNKQEQTAIAKYLDRKTAEIDELIADKKRLLELYEEEKTAIINQAVTKGINPDVKMKDSGIEWLGEIPEHWEVKRLKYLLKINSGEGIQSEQIKPDGTYPVYGGNGIVGYTENYNSDSLQIIIGRVGAKCGNVRLVSGTKWISDNALVANLTASVNLNFLSIQMQNMDLNKMANQNAQPLITGTMVKEKEALFPPIEEQQAIVNHIETECSRIDAKKAKTEKLVDLLTEYRTALISEVVTGKIKVTE
jgi:type I restriction enzyme, S subunit